MQASRFPTSGLQGEGSARRSRYFTLSLHTCCLLRAVQAPLLPKSRGPLSKTLESLLCLWTQVMPSRFLEGTEENLGTRGTEELRAWRRSPSLTPDRCAHGRACRLQNSLKTAGEYFSELCISHSGDKPFFSCPFILIDQVLLDSC